VSPHNPTRYIFSIVQGGYPFPSRALLVGPTNVSAAYQAHIASSLQLAGLAHSAEDAEDAARRIVDFQTALAEVAMTPEELRVPEQVNNVMTVGELEKRTGGLPFLDYLRLAMNNVSLDEDTLANVGQPTQLAALGDLMRSTAPETLRDVMRWSALLSFANDLDEPLARAHFEFFGKTISGIPQQQPMWKRCQNKAQAWMVSRPLHLLWSQLTYSALGFEESSSPSLLVVAV
jgi:predicted metalloendopeptidase